MTTAGQGTDSPAPGGTARLAGRVVARIGFGAMQLEHRGADRSAALAILRQAVGAGVNHIDTAQFYDGCNALIREALSPYPDDLVLVSKVGAERDGRGKLVPAQRPEQLRAQVEVNLATLGVEQLGLVNLRRLDAAPGIVAEGDQLVDLDDQLAELTALRGAGKIGGVGLSSVSADQVGAAAAGRDRVRAESLQRHRPDGRARPRSVPRARHRLGAVLPAWLGLPEPAPGNRPPGRGGGRPRGRRHPRAGGAGLAAVALRPHPADPGHL